MASPDQVIDAIWSDYAANRAERSVQIALRALPDHPAHGPLWFAYACALERVGAWCAADRAFARAARAQDDPQPTPYRIAFPRFTAAVANAIADLPAALQSATAEVGLCLEDYAEPGLLAGFSEPELLGLFSGPTRADRASDPGHQPTTIHLWRRAHEHQCHSAEEFHDEVRQTLWHELGHYLGYDEEELDALGRG